MFPADAKGMATRESSGKVLNALAKNIPWLIGGSADLAKSNKTNLVFEGAGDFFTNEFHGRNIHFGVREHAMGAATNGITITGLRGFSATFFNFSDYMRASMRLAALMELPVLFIFTHDSIGVGEDGPTHQPIEQLASLRAMPNMLVLRPGDANEVTEAYKVAIQHLHGPSTLVFSRQPMPTLDRTKYAPASGVAKGAYVVADADGGKPEVILLASGTELQHCIAGARKAEGRGHQVPRRQHAVLGTIRTAGRGLQGKRSSGRGHRARFHRNGRHARMGSLRRSQGKNSWHAPLGASAPLKDLLKKFGFDPDTVVASAKQLLGR